MNGYTGGTAPNESDDRNAPADRNAPEHHSAPAPAAAAVASSRYGDDCVAPGRVRVTAMSQRAFLRVLAKTHPHPARLVTACEALAMESPGRPGRRLHQYAWFVAAGIDPVEAVSRIPDLLPDAGVKTLRFAQQQGRISEACQAMLAGEPWLDAREPTAIMGLPSELLRHSSNLLVMWAVLAFLGTFILPTFQMMFEEFGLDLPVSFEIAERLVAVVPILIPIAGCILLVLVSLRLPLVVQAVQNRWQPSRGTTEPMPRDLQWRSLLADVIERSEQRGEGARQLAGVYGQQPLGQRFAAIAERVEKGQDLWDTLFQQGLMGRREADALALAHSPDTQAWLLRYDVTRRSHRRDHRRHVFWRFFSLLSLLLMSTIVALVVISVFIVLIRLIAAMA